MDQPQNLKRAGMAFLGAGIACFVTTLVAGQYAFLGVGSAFIGVGVVFLGKSRQAG
ncbi:hypothetical protein [Thermomonas carbonis]|uniref:Uncharacterized protein n=1 Tax=Thermomonas carbonis TaxID=1463158 RepID=A0A7G9SSZ6_9GAMM|nr:hypothetical protein [Thermomonas carbonis]QNN70971.1 hypothetical protein H9L16_05165 [Thermomonas carbonis]GHC03720.1 hypothetical protein GCM10010080_17320 [Thermomonas carbonis]